ncbi:MAG: 50S ribosomal protein L19, partial [Parcubacteria group bacterium]|nr:50S ribosomal protein L19 [Parcubacteria group bacterium]
MNKAPNAPQIQEITQQEIKPGMLIRVHQKIKETTSQGKEKDRIQVYEGLVIARSGAGVSQTMTVRKISNGV